jgi:hypothetical protein
LIDRYLSGDVWFTIRVAVASQARSLLYTFQRRSHGSRAPSNVVLDTITPLDVCLPLLQFQTLDFSVGSFLSRRTVGRRPAFYRTSHQYVCCTALVARTPRGESTDVLANTRVVNSCRFLSSGSHQLLTIQVKRRSCSGLESAPDF